MSKLTPEMHPPDLEHAMKTIPRPEEFFLELRSILRELSQIRNDVDRLVPRIQDAANAIVDPEPGPIKMSYILKCVARHFNITAIDIRSRRRNRSVVRPRQIVMYLCRILTTRSLPEIGQFLGGKDHTTVLFAMKAVETMISNDAEFCEDIKLLIQRIRTGEVK